MAKIVLSVNVPDGVSLLDLINFCRFKFLGSSIDDRALSKFKNEELIVTDVSIKQMNSLTRNLP